MINICIYGVSHKTNTNAGHCGFYMKPFFFVEGVVCRLHRKTTTF